MLNEHLVLPKLLINTVNWNLTSLNYTWNSNEVFFLKTSQSSYIIPNICKHVYLMVTLYIPLEVPLPIKLDIFVWVSSLFIWKSQSSSYNSSKIFQNDGKKFVFFPKGGIQYVIYYNM